MASFLRTALLTLLLLGVAAPAASAAERFIVVYERSVGSVGRETNDLEQEAGFESRHRFSHALKGFSARLTEAQLAEVRDDPQVAAVVRDRIVSARGFVPLAAGEPVPPPGIRRIEAATTTTVREASTSAVAVLDTGIDLDHPDLNAVDGTNCIAPGKPAEDDNGHGTHVAGTIAAKNNGSGVVGVAPGTKVYAVKVLGSDGNGTWSQIICGLDWVTAKAQELHIRVANMSLGGSSSKRTTCSTTSEPLHGAICRAADAGVLSVVAAGNDTADIGSPVDIPSSYPEVLTVTAMTDSDGRAGAAGAAPSCKRTEPDDSKASFSNFATTPADIAHLIAAPGTCIRSTLPDGKWGNMSGTSMAAPHVAGVAAICVGENEADGPCAAMTPAEMITELRDDAVARYAKGAYGFNGDPLKPLTNGRVYGRLANVPGLDPLPAAPAPTPTATPTPAATPAPAATPTPAPAPPVSDPTHDPAPDPAPSDPAPEPEPDPVAPDTTPTPELDAGGQQPAADIPVFVLPQPDVTAPDATVRVPRQRLRSVLRRGLSVFVACTEHCSFEAGLAKSAKLRSRLASAGEERRVVLNLTRAQRRTLARTRRVTVRVRVADAAGNARVLEQRVTVRR